MTFDSFAPYLTGPVAAVVVLLWFVWLQRQDIKYLRQRNEAAEKRATSAEEAARAALATINALAGRDANRASG